MKKIITILIVCIAGLSCNTYAQTSFKWKDSTVTIKGTKVSQDIIAANGNAAPMLQEFYYGFDKVTKTHVVHLVKTNITTSGKEIYLIYKYLIPAAAINTANLKVETADNDAYEGKGFLYLTLRCKDDKEDIITSEKGSHFYDFDNQSKTNEMSFEAGINDKAALEKLIQQIKNNK
jgi:hypothetical protein